MFTSVLEAEIKGDYYFSTIGKDFIQLLQPHLPTIFAEQAESESSKEFENNFRFDVTLKNTEDLSYALTLPFTILRQELLLVK